MPRPLAKCRCRVSTAATHRRVELRRSPAGVRWADDRGRACSPDGAVGLMEEVDDDGLAGGGVPDPARQDGAVAALHRGDERAAPGRVRSGAALRGALADLPA